MDIEAKASNNKKKSSLINDLIHVEWEVFFSHTNDRHVLQRFIDVTKYNKSKRKREKLSRNIKDGGERCVKISCRRCMKLVINNFAWDVNTLGMF